MLVASAGLSIGQGGGAVVAPVSIPAYVPITAGGRVHWFVSNTLGPTNLAAGAITSALATRSNSPPEYGPHWDGYAKRNALRISARATNGLIEGGLGSIWGEDPRYFRATGQTVKGRLDNVLKSIVLAHNREGHLMPAYARYVAIPSGAFITNAWRPDSQTQVRDAVERMTFSLISRLIANTFSEFAPDLFKKFSKKKNAAASNATAVQCAATERVAGC
jgi:hypothetical protein